MLNQLHPQEVGLAEQTNPQEIEKLTQIPVIGVVPYEKRLDSQKPDRSFMVDFFCQHVDISRIEQLINIDL